MFRCWESIFSVLFISSTFSLTCNKYFQTGGVNLTCTGDACLTYFSGGYVEEMGCASNIAFSNRTGCHGDDIWTVCSCRNDGCNNNTIDTPNELQIKPQISCFSGSSKCNGLACNVYTLENQDGEECVKAVSYLSFVELVDNLIAHEQTSRDEFVNGKIYYYLITEFYSGCTTNKCVQKARILRKNGISTNKPSVECHTYLQDRKHNVTCTGDFCYYEYQSGGTTRGCYTVDDSLAERKLTVGFYEYFDKFVYLCDKNLCNANEYSAKMNKAPEVDVYSLPSEMETTTQSGRSSTLLLCLTMLMFLSLF